MQWLNEPASWQRTSGVLTVSVDPGTDFWRQTSYGYIRDSGHVYGEVLAGDLDMSVRIRCTLDTQYDQAGVMLRADEQTWLKTGVEFFESQPRLSTVLTLGRSSWTVTSLPEDADEIVLRVARRDDAVEVRYGTGTGEPTQLAALVYLPPEAEVLAGVMCAAPEGPGFIVSFHDLHIAGRDWDGELAAPAPAGADGERETWAEPGQDRWAGARDGGSGRRWLEPHEAQISTEWPREQAGAEAAGTGWQPQDAGGAAASGEWARQEPGPAYAGPGGATARPEADAGPGWPAAGEDGEDGTGWPEQDAGTASPPWEPAAEPGAGLSWPEPGTGAAPWAAEPGLGTGTAGSVAGTGEWPREPAAPQAGDRGTGSGEWPAGSVAGTGEWPREPAAPQAGDRGTGSGEWPAGPATGTSTGGWPPEPVTQTGSGEWPAGPASGEWPVTAEDARDGGTGQGAAAGAAGPASVASGGLDDEPGREGGSRDRARKGRPGRVRRGRDRGGKGRGGKERAGAASGSGPGDPPGGDTATAGTGPDAGGGADTHQVTAASGESWAAGADPDLDWFRQVRSGSAGDEADSAFGHTGTGSASWPGFAAAAASPASSGPAWSGLPVPADQAADDGAAAAEAGSGPGAAAWRWPDSGSGGDWMQLATGAQARHWIAALASDLGSDWPGPPVPAGSGDDAGPAPGSAGLTGTARDEEAASPGWASADAAAEPAAGAAAQEDYPAGTDPDGDAVPAGGSGLSSPPRSRPGVAADPGAAETDADPGAGEAGPVTGGAVRRPGTPAGSSQAQDSPAAANAGGAAAEPRHGLPPANGTARPAAEPGDPGPAAWTGSFFSRPAASAAADGERLADDATDPHLPLPPEPEPAAQPETRPPAGNAGPAPAGTAAARATPPAGPRDAADEWISLLTTDPADD